MKYAMLFFFLLFSSPSFATKFDSQDHYCSYLAEYALISAVGRMNGITEEQAIVNLAAFVKSRNANDVAGPLKGVVGMVYGETVFFPAEINEIVFDKCMRTR